MSDPAAIWSWRGHRIGWLRAGEQGAAEAVVLIHGFGASSGHWRHTVPALAQQAEVFALDLLGFGMSDKPRSRLTDEPEEPGSVRYGLDLWADQVADFVAERVNPHGQQRPVHLIGNSIGAVVALAAAQRLVAAGHPPAQVVLIDCAQRTLDEKRLGERPPLARALRPLLKSLVRQRWLVSTLFRQLARPGAIRAVLRQAYPSGGNVDDALVALLLRPSTDPGAAESFRGFINLFDDLLAPQLLATLTVPVRMLWGGSDPWEDPAEARLWADTYPCVQELRVLDGLGHCPHDEAPERVNPVLLAWIAGSTAQCT